MELLQIQHRIIGLCLLIAIIALVLFIDWLSGIFCFRHLRYKFLLPFTEKERVCESCVHRKTNPKVKCSCGWKGRFIDLQEYSYNDDQDYKWFCPYCDKEYHNTK